jgi:hypothetical protein
MRHRPFPPFLSRHPSTSIAHSARCAALCGTRAMLCMCVNRSAVRCVSFVSHRRQPTCRDTRRRRRRHRPHTTTVITTRAVGPLRAATTGTPTMTPTPTAAAATARSRRRRRRTTLLRTRLVTTPTTRTRMRARRRRQRLQAMTVPLVVVVVVATPTPPPLLRPRLVHMHHRQFVAMCLLALSS